jgi:hypothetical protein
MEKLYRKVVSKKGKVRYEEAGWGPADLSPGLYFSSKHSHGKRVTSIPYWVGDHVKTPVDISLITRIMSMDDELCSFLQKLTDEDSEAVRILRERGVRILDVPKIYNISMQDLSIAVLRKIYDILVEEYEKEKKLAMKRYSEDDCNPF